MTLESYPYRNIRFVIPGKPIAKQRPRFVRRGPYMQAFNPQETEEGRWIWELRQQWKGKPLEGPLTLRMRFLMPIPKGASKKFLRLVETTFVPHTKRADLDNHLKFCLDCMSGIVFRDDAQVYRIEAEKGFALEPRTEIMVR